MQSTLQIISLLSTLVALLVGMFTYRSLDQVFRIVFLQVVFAITVESLGSYLLLEHFKNNWVYNIYILISTPILGIAGLQLIKNKLVQKVTYFLLFGWMVFWIFYLLNKPFNYFANKAFLSASIFLVAIYIVSLCNLIYYNKPVSNRLPYYLLCIDIVLYYSCNIPTFGLLDYLTMNHPLAAKNIYVINYTLSITYYLTIAFAFLKLSPLKQTEKLTAT